MFERNCPICDKLLFYKNKRKYKSACENLTNCASEYKSWRISVFTRDNFKCCKQGGELQAHHIVGVYENIKLIFDIKNGITLCKKCHKEFHSEYGFKNFPNIMNYEK